MVVLADCDREAADAKVQELQDRVSEIELEVRTGKRMRLAASAGASVFPHDGTTYEALLADADQRMYRDKAARRGRLAPKAAVARRDAEVRRRRQGRRGHGDKID